MDRDDCNFSIRLLIDNEFVQESPLSVAFRRQPETTARNPHHGSQTQWYDVRKLSPTVKGVTEAVRLMHTGETVVIPTESVYMACTSIVFDEGTSKSFPDSCKSSD